MLESMTLELEMLDYWHCGSGKGGSDYLGAQADRDSLGLPFVPGRLLKGLLREALERCEAFGHAAPGSADALFGGRVDRDPSALAPQPGALRVADARLPEPVRGWLRGAEAASFRQALARELFAVAVDEATGGAREGRPRGLEAIVPLVLEAELQPVAGRALPPGWQDSIALALPLVGAVGAYRSRGLGRCALRIKQEAGWAA